LLSTGERYAETLVEETTDVEEGIKSEAVLCGINHCDAGALLAQTWGFPELLQVVMVEHHGHRPVGSGSPVGLIQVACRMADWLGFPELRSAPSAMPVLPQPVLNAPQLEPIRLRELINKQAAILSP
jgi:HD-like signal output (HDOD) protein